MDNKKNDKYYVEKILENVNFIIKYTKNISYEEMHSLSSEGAKVLHDRCVEIGERYDVPLITGSTFNDNPGTYITHKLESSGVKSIVKKDVSRISFIRLVIWLTEKTGSCELRFSFCIDLLYL